MAPGLGQIESGLMADGKAHGRDLEFYGRERCFEKNNIGPKLKIPSLFKSRAVAPRSGISIIYRPAPPCSCDATPLYGACISAPTRLNATPSTSSTRNSPSQQWTRHVPSSARPDALNSSPLGCFFSTFLQRPPCLTRSLPPATLHKQMPTHRTAIRNQRRRGSQ